MIKVKNLSKSCWNTYYQNEYDCTEIGKSYENNKNHLQLECVLLKEKKNKVFILW